MTRARVLLVVALVIVLAGGTGVALVHRTAASPILRTTTLGGDLTGVAVDAQTGHAFVVNRDGATDSYAGDGSGIVSMLAVGSGRVLRTVQVGTDPRSIVLDERDGRAFVPNDDDSTVSILDLHSGALLHTTGVGANPHIVAVDAQTDRAFVVNSGNGTVSVLDARRGVVLHTVHVAPPSFAFLDSAVVDAQAGRVFIGGMSAVYVLDARSGARLRTLLPGQGAGYGANYLAEDARNEHLFIAGRTGLSIVAARSGRLLRAVAASWQPTAIAVDARRGRVYVATIRLDQAATPAIQNRRPVILGGGVTFNGGGAIAFRGGVPAGPGDVQILNARSGALLRTIPTGVAPSAVAVDERTGYVVVVDRGGTVAVPDPWAWVPDGLRRWLPFLAQHAQTRTVPASVSVLDPAK